MFRFMNGASVLALSAAVFATSAAAQEAGEQAENRRLQTVTVTATKRVETAQDIPVAVQALGEQELEALNINVFSDYLAELPGVTAGGGGPGQNTIYIRGVASTTPNLTTAGVAGLAPNVAFYLDEQPLAQPGRNLDVYAADMERIEVLPGPQGTLFGSSSQAGTVRLITNKPVLGEFEAAAKASTSFTDGGEMSNSVEAMINLPVTEDFALRGVVYTDNQGGYIDNVPGTRSVSESARFREAGTVRDNGVPVSDFRAGLQAGADLSDVTFLDANNADLVEKDFNDTTYSGFRVSGRYEFNSDWRLDVAHAQQRLDTEGVFFQDPDLGDYEIQRFSQDDLEDSFHNTSWTLEGRLGMLETVYTGAFTERDTDQTVDYSDYMFVGQYLPYYICDGSVTYPGDAAPSGTCYEPYMFVDSTTNTSVLTQELRFNTPAENRLRATAGVFYSDLELEERNDYAYLGSRDADVFGTPPGGIDQGFAPNFPFMTGFTSDPGPFPSGVIFRNDVRRTDEQIGAFGEATFELVPETFAVTLGARYYDIEVDLEGGANASFCNSFQADADAFGTDISDLYNADGEYTFRGTCDTSRHITYTDSQSVEDILATDPALSEAQAQQIFQATRAPDTASTDGVIVKVNAEWTPTSDLLFYATYSEGFRPGLLNRPGGAQGPEGFSVPFVLDTDDVTNYELGWKTFLLDGQLRFNGSAFFVEVENLQTTIFDPNIVNLFFSANAANAEVTGIEGDFAYAPDAIEGLTVSGAFSALDTEITDVLLPTDDVLVGEPLAFAPEFQGNLRARYEWPVEFQGESYDAYVMPRMVYSSESFTDVIEINKVELDSYTMFGLSAGVVKDNWSVEVFGNNLTNETAETSGTFVNDRARITVARPRTIGVRVGLEY